MWIDYTVSLIIGSIVTRMVMYCVAYTVNMYPMYTAAVTCAATADHNNDSGANLTSLTTGVAV